MIKIKNFSLILLFSGFQLGLTFSCFAVENSIPSVSPVTDTSPSKSEDLDANSGSHNNGSESYQFSKESLSTFLKMNQSIGQAVCNEEWVSKAPTLALKGGFVESKGTFGSGSSGAGRVQGNDPNQVYKIALKVPESEIIGFLLDDSLGFVAHPSTLQAWRIHSQIKDRSSTIQLVAIQEEQNRLRTFKKQISTDICLSLVTPDTFETFVRKNPGLFIIAESLQGRGTPKSKIQNKSEQSFWYLTDPDDRFGAAIQKKGAAQSWIAGWIEPYEVKEVHFGNRILRRLSHPVTHNLSFVQVLSSDGYLLGVLEPAPVGSIEPQGLISKSIVPAPGSIANEVPLLDSELSNEQLKELKKKQVDNFRVAVEFDAYVHVKMKPDLIEKIKNLQEFYKNLLNAYQIFPTDPQFERFQKKSDWSDQKTLKLIDAAFRTELARARVNQARVEIRLFKFDSKLENIYREFSTRLKELK